MLQKSFELSNRRTISTLHDLIRTTTPFSRLFIVANHGQNVRSSPSLGETVTCGDLKRYRLLQQARNTDCLLVSLFVCLFVWSLLSHSRIFHPYGDVTMAGEGLQSLTYAWHSWPLSSKGSLTCHTHCDTCLPFIMVFSEDP